MRRVFPTADAVERFTVFNIKGNAYQNSPKKDSSRPIVDLSSSPSSDTAYGRLRRKALSLAAAKPLEALRFLMEDDGLKQKDLVDVCGTRSIASEVLNGKPELNKAHIRRLSKRFHVSPEIFF